MQTSKLLITSTLAGLVTLTLANEDITRVKSNHPGSAEEINRSSSPVLGIQRDLKRRQEETPREQRYRTIDGSQNNLLAPEMNQADTALARHTPIGYSDLVSSMGGDSRPSARAISNMVNTQSGFVANPVSASDFLWQWGQFLDHDLDLTDGVDPPESADIPIPKGDTQFDPKGTGTQTMSFNRAIYDAATGHSTVNPRQQLNEITGWIDASNVYGSDIERANALRTNDGTGKLRTFRSEFLPFNEAGLPNAGGSGSNLFLAGDVRANEQVGLTVMHTLFVREHNRLAEEIARRTPNLTGEEIYQRARRIVGAQMQVITYEEFLPVLLGENSMRPYDGYDESIDARVANVFSAAAYRLGHSMLSSHILRLDKKGNEIAAGHLPLRDAFFSPKILLVGAGIEPILRGLAAQVCQRVDVLVVDDVRNFLFGNPGSGGFDLTSLNIQRGRDHGLPNYNAVREAFGLPARTAFSEITSSLELQDRLAAAYGSIDDMDVWVAGLAEDPLAGSMLGELFHRVVARQFEVLRTGDRFWYERSLSREELREVAGTRLADIIRRNTTIGQEINDNVFVVEQPVLIDD